MTGADGGGPRELVLPDPPDFPALLQLRVELDEADPPIWRRLMVRGDLPMDRFHRVLQATMGWQDYHLHRFWVGTGGRDWSRPFLLTDGDVEEGEEGPHERDVRVDQLVRDVGDELGYTYDFGDGWEHTVEVEALAPLPEDHPPAVVTDGENACPPEDVGGIGAHNELVAAYLEAPDLSLIEPHVVQWLPPEWDPTEFDAAQANLLLAVGEAGPEQLARLGSEGPWMHPALEAFLGRLPAHAVLTFATDTAAAMGDPDERGETALDEETLSRALRPWRLLMELAQPDGIPLTQAGWMKPHDVQLLMGELEVAWVGKGNREDLSAPVAVLRRGAQQLGLLRRHKGRLLLTPAARRLAGDDRALWRHLTVRVVPEGEEFTRDATALYLLRVARDGSVDHDAFAEIARWLTLAGWEQTDGAPVDPWDVMREIRPVVQLVDLASSRAGSHPREGDAVIARALARGVLFGGPPEDQ